MSIEVALYQTYFFDFISEIFTFYNSCEVVIGIVLIYPLIVTMRSFPKKMLISRERLPFFDFVKGIAVVLVIASHAADLVPQLYFLRTYIQYPALTFFLIASGYLLTVRYLQEFDLRRYFQSILVRVVIIYFIVTLIIQSFFGNFSLREIGPDLIFGRTNENTYFIPLILGCYGVFPFLRKMRGQLASYSVMTVIFLFSFFFFLLDYHLQKPNWNSNEWSLIFFGRFLFFFCFGMALADTDIHRIGIRHVWKLFAMYGAIVLGVSLYLREPYVTYIYSVVLFLFVLFLYNIMPQLPIFLKPIKYIGELGKLSILIYLFHTRFMYNLVQPYGMKHLNAMSLAPSQKYFIIIVVVILLSVISSILFNVLYEYAFGKFGIVLREQKQDMTVKQ